MKPILFILLALLMLNIIVCSSCRKSNSSATAASIAGKWKWVDTYFDYPLSDSNPLTPVNSGIQELLIFNTDATWKKIQNNKTVDSGTYSTGYGSYYDGWKTYTYDSVKYIKSITGAGRDYYKLTNDTLQFCGVFAGLIGSSSKLYIRQ